MFNQSDPVQEDSCRDARKRLDDLQQAAYTNEALRILEELEKGCFEYQVFEISEQGII